MGSYILGALLMMVTLVGPTVMKATARAQDAEASEGLIRRFYAEALTFNGDLEALDDLLAEDFVPQNPDDIAGPDAYKQRRADQREALAAFGFESWAYEIEELIATEDQVAVRATFRGTLGSGEVREANQLAWFEIRDGRIARIWTEQDTDAMLGR